MINICINKFLFRIDDVCPEMDWRKFYKLCKIFDELGVKPLLAVIPQNEDLDLKKGKFNDDFWKEIRNMKSLNYTIGMHGYLHKSENNNSGILKINKRSEFSGLSFDNQLLKIRDGAEIFKNHGLDTKFFIAPYHSFDKNTIKALKEEKFYYISDGIALWPFKKNNILFIPQISGKVRKFPFGIITFCFHPNSLNNGDFLEIEKFIEKNKDKIVTFDWAANWFEKYGENGKACRKIINTCFAFFWYSAGFVKKAIKNNCHGR